MKLGQGFWSKGMVSEVRAHYTLKKFLFQTSTLSYIMGDIYSIDAQTWRLEGLFAKFRLSTRNFTTNNSGMVLRIYFNSYWIFRIMNIFRLLTSSFYLQSVAENTTFVVHHNNHIPYMPSELRHTNYNSKPHPINPQVDDTISSKFNVLIPKILFL